MIKNQFANSTEDVTKLGFGCWGIGKSEWMGATDSESKKALLRAIEEGINFFDTALAYGDGHSESLVGQAEKESGKTIFVASKIPSKKYEWPASDFSTLEESFPRKYIIESTERSLRNLNRDYIDLMQFHVWNDRWSDNDEWKEAVQKLKDEGKVRYFGISINDHEPENGILAGKTGLIDSFQVIFNIFEQKPLIRLFPFCKKNKIAVIARVPFDEGALTGNITHNVIFPPGDFREKYFQGKRKSEVELRVKHIWDDVKNHVEDIAEAALRFTISFEAVTTVIPGMRSERNLLANVKSIGKGPLPKEILARLKIHKWDKNFYE